MALRPADRYPTLLALAEDLEHWLADDPVSAWPEPITIRARRWVRKHPGPVAGIVAARSAGSSGRSDGSGKRSSRYSLITADSGNTQSPSRITGTLPEAFSA